MKEKIEKVLNEKVRPMLQMEGGDVEFVKYDERRKQVQVRLIGACAGCPGAQMTLQSGIETALKEAIPEIDSVVAV
jgi:Fe-S cluster biogenesis protein NfuA